MIELDDMGSMLNLRTFHMDGGIWYEKGVSQVRGVFEEDMHDELFELEDKSWWFKHRNRIIEAGVSKYPPPSNTIVDVGGGNGFVSAHLASKGIETILFEPGIQGIKNAHRRGLNNLICAPFNGSAVINGSVPAIGLFDVLEHMEKEVVFLQDMHKALIPNGMLYVTVPAHNVLWSDEDEVAGHFRRYSRKNLRKTLEDNGFSVVFISHFFRMLSPAIFMIRSLPYKMGGKKNIQKNDNSNKEFVVPSAIDKISAAFFGKEVNKILNGQRIFHGSSIFAVARKV
jgi:SAM-dependent methyltransferase